MHQHLLLRPVNIITTNNIIVMYHGLFTGRSPGFALAMIRTTPEPYRFKMHYKSAFPAGNVPRCPEAGATDYVYSDTPAIDDGSAGAQFYCGLKAEVVDIYGCKTDAQFVDTLEDDNIRKRGAMEKLISDHAKSEISTHVHDMHPLQLHHW